MRKLVAMILAIIMIAIVGLTFAETNSLTNGVVAGSSNAALSDESINIVKEITAFNQDSETIHAPLVTYTYTVAPADASALKSVTDSENVTAVAKAGITTGLKVNNTTGTTGTISWNSSTDTMSTAAAGTANSKNLTLDFSGVDFDAAGIYRYTITEALTSPSSYAAAGITETGGSHVRYLDVYVKDGTGTGAAAWDVYGFVCFYNDTNDEISASSTSPHTNNLTSVVKTNGFVPGTTDGSTTNYADRYFTFNLTVSKTLVNDQAMNNNKFPFAVSLANTSVTQDVYLKTKTVKDGAAAVAGSDVHGVMNTGETGLQAISTTIDHQSNVKYIGIPVGVTTATRVTVKEQNNVTGTIYKSQYSLQGAALTGDKNIANNDWSNIATMSAITANQADTTSHTIGFTNTLETISPTGYVSRFAPYALILVGGVALLVIAMKKRKHTEED